MANIVLRTLCQSSRNLDIQGSGSVKPLNVTLDLPWPDPDQQDQTSDKYLYFSFFTAPSHKKRE